MMFLVIRTYRSAYGLGGHKVVAGIEDESQVLDTIVDLIKKMNKMEVKSYTEDMKLVLFENGIYNIANIPEANGLSEEAVIKMIDKAWGKAFDEVLEATTCNVLSSLMGEYTIVGSKYAEIRDEDLYRFIDG